MVFFIQPPRDAINIKIFLIISLQSARVKHEFNKVGLKSFGIMNVLSMNLLTIGKYDGFSIVLMVSGIFSVILYFHLDPWKY